MELLVMHEEPSRADQERAEALLQRAMETLGERAFGADADAIGEEPTKPLTAEAVGGRSTQELAWDQLKTVFDKVHEGDTKLVTITAQTAAK